MIPVFPQPITLMAQNPMLATYPGQQDQVKNTQEQEVEVSAQQLMKGANFLNVERKENCIQCFWDFRDVTYESQQLGNHKVRRFQPNLINQCICWPLKMCCCTFTIPAFVTNDIVFQEGAVIHFANRYHGVVYAKGIAIGSYELESPSLCAWLCINSQPKVIIKKAVTGETFTLKANDSCGQALLERFSAACVFNKEMYVDKNGQRIIGNYSRSCCQAFWNASTFNHSFFNKLDINFNNFIKSDADKVLIYGAFIFLQENTNKFRGCFC